MSSDSAFSSPVHNRTSNSRRVPRYCLLLHLVTVVSLTVCSRSKLKTQSRFSMKLLQPTTRFVPLSCTHTGSHTQTVATASQVSAMSCTLPLAVAPPIAVESGPPCCTGQFSTSVCFSNGLCRCI
ncbi:unnamed protein product [Pylaiella littoralis]